MPDGEYCDLMQGNPTDEGCTGPTITVAGGKAGINVPTGDAPMSAISVDYPATGGCSGGCPPDGGNGGNGGNGGDGSCTSCSCSNKVGPSFDPKKYFLHQFYFTLKKFIFYNNFISH